jgi:hypothetical protein
VIEYDEEKVDDAVLSLLYLTMWEDYHSDLRLEGP